MNDNRERIILFRHGTDGGAVYLTESEPFSESRIIIRLDGGAELMKCEVPLSEPEEKEIEVPA